MSVDRFQVVVHHSGHFFSNGKLEYDGETTTWFCDPDTWGYFEVIAGLKELGHVSVKELWYSLGGGTVLEDRLELLCDDRGASHMANLATLNGAVHLYVVHEMTEPEIINMIKGVGMGEVGPSEADDVANCVNEADEHGVAEVVEKEGGEGEEDVEAEVLEKEGGEGEQDVESAVLEKEGGEGEQDVTAEVVEEERGEGEQGVAPEVVEKEGADEGDGVQENEGEPESFNEEGLVDVNINSDGHSDSDWDGNVPCAVESAFDGEGWYTAQELTDSDSDEVRTEGGGSDFEW